jgi:hypothetical protein
VIELAIVPARAIRLSQTQHRDVALAGERAHLSTKAVADLRQQRRRWDLIAEMAAQEAHYLSADLHRRQIRVQV